MKKTFLFAIALGLAAIAHAQSEVESEQIRRCADSLGVPYAALRRLVETHRGVETGLSDPNAQGARILSVRELDFMAASNMLIPGDYYVVHATFNGQQGRSAVFWAPDSHNWFSAEANFMLDLPEGTQVTVLIKRVRGDFGWQGFDLVEVAPR